jgi:asparagine synthase (glutamine-hydrolysing)
MCGITGFVSTRSFSEEDLNMHINKMSSVLSHRGPDDTGSWIDKKQNISLGHKRLSILDLSAAGHQPMISDSNRYIIVFNGEIYNHLMLRKEIDKSSSEIINWSGTSDTETLLKCFDIYGIKNSINKLIGMFSIAVYDKKNNDITLIRDRLGEKPLYYGMVDGSFVFGSELKALKQFPNFNNPIDRFALKKYFEYLYVPAPYSIYEGIFKLEPGHILRLSLSDIKSNVDLMDLRKNITQYWNLEEKIKKQSRDEQKNIDDNSITDLEEILKNSVDTQMISDVPIGAFLSGGIDSSLIASLMQRNSSKPIQTFTIGFEESSFDESEHAKKVANHLGTDHFELFVTSNQAKELIPKLPFIYDEPFADSSQIPTFFVCASAAQKVKVSLSGDGGDELFGGYNRYFWGPRLWKNISWMPLNLRKIIGKSIGKVSDSTWNKFERSLDNACKSNNFSNISNKVKKVSKVMSSSNNINDIYISLITEWNSYDDLVLDVVDSEIKQFGDPLKDKSISKDFAFEMMFRDTISYLPDDILCKVDRASMANSIETRVPFLDHRVVEYAWNLPNEMKINNNIGKWSLRKILNNYVPLEIIDRPKAGFAVPIGEWLRGPLKDWAEELLNPEKLISQGYIDHEKVTEIWEMHLSRNFDETPKIWSILMFQSWLEAQ